MRIARRVALVAVIVSLVMLSLGVVSCSSVDFLSNKQAFDQAAAKVLEHEGAPGAWETAILSDSQQRLARDGQAYYFNRAGREFAFFPQEIDKPNFYVGYLYSADGRDPGDLLDTEEDLIQVAPGWWKGQLSQGVLAGG